MLTTFLGSFPDPALLPAAGLPEVAFAGRSNVGKSSAINALVNQKIARSSRTPGRTQALNLFEIQGRFILVDLPGYGYARVPEAVRIAWGPLVEGYLLQRPSLRLVVALIDASLPAQELDADLIAGLRGTDVPLAVVATRVDRLGKAERKPTLARLAAAHGLALDEMTPFSSKTREGVTELWAMISKSCPARR